MTDSRFRELEHRSKETGSVDSRAAARTNSGKSAEVGANCCTIPSARHHRHGIGTRHWRSGGLLVLLLAMRMEPVVR